MSNYRFRDRMRDTIISKRALFLCRTRLGVTGINTFVLPKDFFHSCIEHAFSDHEQSIMLSRRGLVVPTYDEGGRVFDVDVLSLNIHYELTGGPNGWNRLSRMNRVEANTIVLLWIYCEHMEVGPIMELPRFLVLTEDNLLCSHCKRDSIFYNII